MELNRSMHKADRSCRVFLVLCGDVDGEKEEEEEEEEEEI